METNTVPQSIETRFRTIKNASGDLWKWNRNQVIVKEEPSVNACVARREKGVGISGDTKNTTEFDSTEGRSKRWFFFFLIFTYGGCARSAKWNRNPCDWGKTPWRIGRDDGGKLFWICLPNDAELRGIPELSIISHRPQSIVVFNLLSSQRRLLFFFN